MEVAMIIVCSKADMSGLVEILESSHLRNELVAWVKWISFLLSERTNFRTLSKSEEAGDRGRKQRRVISVFDSRDSTAVHFFPSSVIMLPPRWWTLQHSMLKPSLGDVSSSTRTLQSCALYNHPDLIVHHELSPFLWDRLYGSDIWCSFSIPALY